MELHWVHSTWPFFGTPRHWKSIPAYERFFAKSWEGRKKSLGDLERKGQEILCAKTNLGGVAPTERINESTRVAFIALYRKLKASRWNEWEIRVPLIPPTNPKGAPAFFFFLFVRPPPWCLSSGAWLCCVLFLQRLKKFPLTRLRPAHSLETVRKSKPAPTPQPSPHPAPTRVSLVFGVHLFISLVSNERKGDHTKVYTSKRD